MEEGRERKHLRNASQKDIFMKPIQTKKDRCSRSPLLCHPSTHSRLVINFVWGSRLQLALCFCIGKSRLLAYAYVVTIATNADRLTMPERTNLTWSLSHVLCSAEQPWKINRYAWPPSTKEIHKETAEDPLWVNIRRSHLCATCSGEN